MALDYPEEHRREALAITAAIVLLLALVCFFLKFNGPNPPLTALGGDGVELNYGLDEAGSGDIQTMATANASQNREDSRPPAARQPQPTPQPRTAPTPAPQPEAQAKVITSDAEDAGATAPPVTKPTPKVVEPVRETPTPPKPREQPRTLYTPKGSATGVAGGNGTNGTSSAPTGNSNGDHPGAVGDQGDPRGSLNAKALYGEPGSGGSGARPGSGGGGGLEMSGWRFDNTPVVEALDDNPGVIRFKLKISDDGEVESVSKVSGNVSPAQEKLCRDKLLNANFVKTNAGAGGATGFYTFRFTVK
ncbi:hypothetical protein E4631_15890 [Hymenobacter sp. UV11]|uniref:hypothetical protein n=1 Tax=Hymenobacter sp. UV11 TaxID=1849735 RepID=UPI00105B7B2D|nr:hypothetical protein [Hymenobacter sp. UV11]TDN39228.1 hypothetical protein A8B98_18350 [Hymenobacter sp. UV11]TFZ65696.1 hypothetical protein E4631_15890 [Hymenobacter sp. UV11]